MAKFINKTVEISEQLSFANPQQIPPDDLLSAKNKLENYRIKNCVWIVFPLLILTILCIFKTKRSPHREGWWGI
jgi:hypothetical protein